ncbi:MULTISPECIES: aldehyde dehydrogenase family protein [unclassified Streptomyces]|uniref:aldehyde dehydrogenase family protein n=1 Tax=unclassified Streptomyces TaxID=2593676 RepID=UPI00225101D0|nr:aldehyde dehydrogenase family protein [Streptomyces sp. NBC_00047]MCX5610522.1 aldehyde dehydrogenase family protein [Streptomyces sp. NBC_00047]
MNTSALDTSFLDLTVGHVRGSAKSWSATPLTERIALLERLLPRVVSRASEMAAAGARAKGYASDSPWAAEDWIAGPWALAQNASAYLHVLRRIAAGKDPVDAKAVHEEDGRTRVDVFPATGWDSLLLGGFTAQVWMRPGTTAEQARSRAAGEYRDRPGRPGVSLVLGAGNVAAITALDILHKLFAEGQVVIAKMNPVNDYLRPHFDHVFAEFVEHGWVRFVDGGAAEGGYLAAHEDVDAIHVTGSDRTHDAIVWGTDEDAEQRRHDDRPLLDKPFSSELGGVSPCIVVPGPWSDADFRFQAEHVVTTKMNNSGHNCIASQILVLPRDWDGTERLLAEIRRLLRELPPRTDYYPGAAGRLASVLAAHPEAEAHDDGCRLLVPDITDHDDVLITEEVFGSALGVLRLPGHTPAEFLRHAVDFANNTLPGTLGATLIVHPRTEKAHREAVRSAIADLRYGTLGVNCWSAVGFLLGFTPWGAHPGHTRQDIGSGIGFVHNAFMLEDIEKTVLRAPFTPAPRGLVTGDPSLSPRPPYFVTHRTALTTVERLTRFTAAPSVMKLPALFASALRG